jgi:hypothetical protein
MVDMRQSTTYQAILREGRIMGGQRILLRLGAMKFGNADGATLIAIEEIRDFERLEAMCARILDADVRDWSEVLRTR